MFDVRMMIWKGRRIILLSALLGMCVTGAQASGMHIAVVYPQVTKPYQEVFDHIIDGIRQEAASPVSVFVMKEGDDSSLNDWLLQRKIKTVIALGKQGLDATDKLPAGIRRVFGGLLSPPLQPEVSQVGGIVLSPDPEIVFAKIHELVPGVRKVTVVYDPANSDWLIHHAREAALKSGLELNAVQAADLREAATAYAQLLDKGLGKTDLVWLLNDPSTIDQSTILPLLLKTSWSDNFAVISNNPGHVKRGVLFALYPDYVRMGKSLGRLATQVAAGADSSTIWPLADVLIAVNLRTAEHLNLIFSQKEKDAFNLVFPESR